MSHPDGIRRAVLRDLRKMSAAPDPDREASLRLRDRLASFVRNHPRCTDRRYGPGHLTASGFVVDPVRSRVLLILHRKLSRWLQPGGHLEPGEFPADAARREVEEETGLSLRPVHGFPFDVDVHRIPARPGEGAHAHFDLRYLFCADSTQPVGSPEVADWAWVALSDLREKTDEVSILRMARRVQARGFVQTGRSPIPLRNLL